MTVLGRLMRSDRRRIERRNASGMRLNFGVSGGAFRSGRKKFFTASIVMFDLFSFPLSFRGRSEQFVYVFLG